MTPGSPSRAVEGLLTQLVYELLDAHHDTMELALEGVQDRLRWHAHLDYLRALQRTARELLAKLAADPSREANPAEGRR